jgi:hypothetical protein
VPGGLPAGEHLAAAHVLDRDGYVPAGEAGPGELEHLYRQGVRAAGLDSQVRDVCAASQVTEPDHEPGTGPILIGGHFGQ